MEKLGASYFQDPYSLQARLREEGPVVQVQMPEGYPAWLITRYADVRAALADPRLSKDWRKFVPPRAEGNGADSIDEMMGVHMLNMDPPDHERQRRLVTKAFTPGRVEGLRPRVAEITASLLDNLAAAPGHEVDLLELFAFPLPVTVISELLGIPAKDRDKFRAWSNAAVSSVAEQGEMRATNAEMIQYFSAHIDARHGAAGVSDDLLSALVQAQDQDDRLSTGELISLMFLLLIAGHETTVNLIASGTLALLRDPAARARLRDDRSLLPAAIEEMLRYTSPVNHSTFRFTLEPVTIAGVDIPARQIVIAGLSSANRDGSRFAKPGSFDIDRAERGGQAGGHVAFGHGIHYCLGAPLARLEAEIAFGGLLDRFPDMTLAVPPADLRWRPSTLIRGLETLPVRLHG
jgi:cytochrome P450